MASPSPILMTPDQLAGQLGQPHIRVVDATWFMPNAGRVAEAEYRQGHIPGAVFFHIDAISDTQSPLPHMLPTPEQFAEAVGRLGITNSDTVVVYDGQGLFSAARVWWTFKVFGHPSVFLLNGGLPKWREAGHPVTDDPTDITPAHYEAGWNPKWVRSRAQVQQESLMLREAQWIDLRPADRFWGSAPEPRPGLRSGHAPGSINIPFAQFLNPDDMTVLPPEALTKLLQEKGVHPEQPVIFSCGSGVTACIGFLALSTLGYENLAVYDGSWAEWGAESACPVIQGEAPCS